MLRLGRLAEAWIAPRRRANSANSLAIVRFLVAPSTDDQRLPARERATPPEGNAALVSEYAVECERRQAAARPRVVAKSGVMPRVAARFFCRSGRIGAGRRPDRIGFLNRVSQVRILPGALRSHAARAGGRESLRLPVVGSGGGCDNYPGDISNERVPALIASRSEAVTVSLYFCFTATWRCT